VEAVARATVEAARLSGIVAWAQSYVVEETNGSIGSICVYEAVSPEAVRHHSDAAELPVDEIVKVADTIVLRPDSAATAA
jgi:sporulation protein YlmC with PRC-barrel domain